MRSTRTWATTLGVAAAATLTAVATMAPVNAAGQTASGASHGGSVQGVENDRQQARAAWDSELGWFEVNGVNIRKRASTSAPILGQGFRGQRITWHCNGTNPRGWAYITHRGTGITGWVDDQYVSARDEVSDC